VWLGLGLGARGRDPTLWGNLNSRINTRICLDIEILVTSLLEIVFARSTRRFRCLAFVGAMCLSARDKSERSEVL
jgi:hypothetical protein